MLKITIPELEMFDERTNEFVLIKGQTLTLEHSLVSISKWESIYHKAFLGREKKTFDETVAYIKCMTLTQNVDSRLYFGLTNLNIDEVNAYLENSMTATTFSNLNRRSFSREIVTSELIYYWMFSLGIPKECEKWHLNRLLTLIRIFNVKGDKPRKMSARELAARNTSLNEARRKALHSKG